MSGPQPPDAPGATDGELKLTFSALRRDRSDRRGERIAADLLVEAIVDGELHGGATTAFVTPFGPIEADALRWYLEIYPGWPFGTFHERATKIEGQLSTW